MGFKKLIKKITPKIAFVFWVKGKAKQKEEAAEELTAARNRAQVEARVEIKFSLLAFGLRFLIEDYLKEENFDPQFAFGTTLKKYIELMEISRKKFAEEMHISIEMLSQLIDGQLMPDDSIVIRLELHSNNNIPATYWLKLAGKQRLHAITKDKELRKKEQAFVYNKLPVKEYALSTIPFLSKVNP